MHRPTIQDVKNFWNNNPLLSGELDEELGSKEWFNHFDKIKIPLMREDKLPLWVGKDLIEGKKMLDVGCGPGFWCRYVRDIKTHYHGIDISEESVKLASHSAQLFGTSCNIQVGNAEEIDYPNAHFDHVLSEGVIHHTPDTGKALHEIIRVLKMNGTATVSVYYKNILLRNNWLFQLCQWTTKLFKLTIKGRGREKMRSADSVEEFVRMYDGALNPIGKAYTYDEFVQMLPKGVVVKESYLYFSPLRAFFRNRFERINRLFDSWFGLMICFCLVKTSD